MNFSNYLPELPSGKSVVVALMLAPFTSLLATSSWAQAAPKYAGKVPASVTTPDTVQTRIGTLKFFDGAARRSNRAESLRPARLRSWRRSVPGGHSRDLGLCVVRRLQGSGISRERGHRHHREPGGRPRAVPHAELDRRLCLVLRGCGEGADGRAGAARRAGHDRRCLFPLRHRSRPARARPGQGRQVSAGAARLPGRRCRKKATSSPSRAPTATSSSFAPSCKNGDIAAAVRNVKENARMYPLSAAANPPAQKFVNISGKQFNTVHANDFHFYEELNAVVQHEPADFLDPETAGLFAAIGIKKGKPFAPDARMKAILVDAVAVGNAASRAQSFMRRAIRDCGFIRTGNGSPPSSAAVMSSPTAASGCSMRARCSTTTPPASRRRWPRPSPAPARPMRSRPAIRRAATSTAARPTRSRCRRRSLPPGSGRSRSTTTRPVRCWRPTRSSPASTAHLPDLKKNADGSVTVWFAPKAPAGSGGQLGADHARQGLEHAAAALRAAGALVRQDLEAGRFRAGGVSGPVSNQREGTQS